MAYIFSDPAQLRTREELNARQARGYLRKEMLSMLPAPLERGAIIPGPIEMATVRPPLQYDVPFFRGTEPIPTAIGKQVASSGAESYYDWPSNASSRGADGSDSQSRLATLSNESGGGASGSRRGSNSTFIALDNDFFMEDEEDLKDVEMGGDDGTSLFGAGLRSRRKPVFARAAFLTARERRAMLRQAAVAGNDNPLITRALRVITRVRR